jgi:hypothetical protein
MDIGGMNCVAHDRLRSTRIHLDVTFPYSLKHSPSIKHRLVERGVAVDGTDAEEVNARVMGGEQESVGILDCI